MPTVWQSAVFWAGLRRAAAAAITATAAAEPAVSAENCRVVTARGDVTVTSRASGSPSSSLLSNTSPGRPDVDVLAASGVARIVGTPGHDEVEPHDVTEPIMEATEVLPSRTHQCVVTIEPERGATALATSYRGVLGAVGHPQPRAQRIPKFYSWNIEALGPRNRHQPVVRVWEGESAEAGCGGRSLGGER
jgi:hypothetical protein